MGKRRNAKNNHPYHGGGSNSRIIGHSDGDTSKKDKLSVFDFADEDERVEMDSIRSLSKFVNKSPSKKRARYRSLDKYDFLSSFARGSTTSQNNYETKQSVIDVSDNFFQDRNVRPDVSISYDSSNCRLMPKFSQNHFDSEYFSGGEKSYSYGKVKSGGCATDKSHNKVLYIESDDDGMMEMRSTTSSFDLAENEGSVEELSSEHGVNANDCEAVVVVAPVYVKYGNVYYTKCFLTFSQRCIRLEGSPLCEKKGHHCLEWSICDMLKIDCQQCESVKADVVNLHFKLKVPNVAETCDLISDIVELEFVVTDDSKWSNKQEEIRSLDLKYKAAWKTITCKYSSSVAFAFEDVIYPEGDPDAVSISRRDVELLQPRTFINDTIIDFYMKYLLNKFKTEEQHRFHIFNTFFFRKLADLDQDSCRAWEGNKVFQRVRKWTRNVNLFEKDYIFIPVNFSLHWSLIVICHSGKVANLREEEVDNPSEVPCILHMDSIRGSHRGFENLIRSYLWEEWKDRHNKQEASMKFLNLHFIALKVPQQENLFDCGLFLLHYAELFLELATNFSTTRYSDWLNEDLFLPAEVSLKKRDYIRNLIHRIVGDNALKDPAACNDTCLPRDNANEGDSGVKFVKEINVKDMSHDIKFDSSVDQEIHMTSVRTPIIGQQSLVDMLEPGNTAKAVDEESFKPCEQLVSINQFSNMRLPTEEEALEKQVILLSGYTANRHEAGDNYTSMPAPHPLGNFRTTKMEVQCRTCTVSSVSPIIIDLQNEEEHVPEVDSTTEKEKNEYKYTSITSEDLAACVVEDSEEEKETKSLSKTRRHSFSTVPDIWHHVN